MKICVLAPMYFPAHKAGGPVPGIMGVVESLHGSDVHVFASNHDLGETDPYPPPYRGTIEMGGATVTYLPSPGLTSITAWASAFREIRGSKLICLNSLMSTGFTVVPLLLLWATRFRGQVAISPRGELAASALRLGGFRQKKIWILLLRALGLDVQLGGQRVTWVASTEHERADVNRTFPKARVVIVPEHLRPSTGVVRTTTSLSGALRVISVGRLAPVKGHDRLLRGLTQAQRPVAARIVGLAEDAVHVAELDALLAVLPRHVTASCEGALRPDEVERELGEAHLFVLLTHGESFGHAIGEALRAGCPVLISDQTAWSDVADARAGVVLTTAECDDPHLVAREIDRFADMSNEDWQTWSRRAQAYISSGNASVTLLEAMASLSRQP